MCECEGCVPSDSFLFLDLTSESGSVACFVRSSQIALRSVCPPPSHHPMRDAVVMCIKKSVDRPNL